MNEPILAIDPGVSGGITYRCVKDGCIPVVEHAPMPATEGDIVSMIAGKNRGIAYVEDVPKFCGRSLPASSIAVMYGNFKFCIGVLMALGWRVQLVKPQAWQKALALGHKEGNDSRTKTAWKNKLKAEAQRLYPGLHVTLKTADALLILEYARKAEGMV